MADSKRVREQLKEITDRLEQGIIDVFESEKYKEYLNTMSKFYNYSFNNTMLIAMQKPDATLIAGHKAWPSKFERHVKRGEKGIRIIAPAPVTVKEELEKLDPVTQEPMLDEHGNPVMEEVEIRMPNFKVISVFDVSQTEGKELPDLVVDELTGDVKQYDMFMQALTEVSPVPIGYEDISNGAKGYYHLEDKRIAIQTGMSQIQNSKTVIHEIAHATLHDIELNNPMAEAEQRKDRKTKEVEAESIAYAVCQHYAIDTSDYSFGYVAGWSSDKELKELKSSLETIRKTAATLINAIDERMAELQLTKEQEVTEPIKDEDVIVMVSASMGSEYEIDKITNMESEEVRAILEDMAALPEESWDGNAQAYLEYRGAKLEPIMYSGSSLGDGYPKFYDFEYDFDTNRVYAATELSPVDQVENLMDRMEFDRPVFNDEERKLLVNYTRQFANMEDTRALAIELRDALDAPDAGAIYEVMERARAEIEALPDQRISFTERNEYGYTSNILYPLTKGRAVELWEQDLPILLLYPDNTEAYAESIDDIMDFDGIFGIEQDVWAKVQTQKIERESVQEELPQSPEDLLLHGEENRFGIYQLKEEDDLHYHRFEGLDRLKSHGLQVEKKNYELIYTAPLQEGQTLDDIFEQFNLFRPEDFTGHSLSVSDIVLLHKDGVNTAQYVDSFGFQKIPDFLELQAAQEMIQQTEAAYEFADRYLMIHACDDGYDYTFYDKQYKEIDGGVYDDPDVTLEEAVHIILTDDPFPNMERTVVDYEELDEKVEEANRIIPLEEQEKISSLSDRTEPMEDLNGMSPAEIEETVLAYAQTKAEEYGHEVQVLAARVYGSRTAGIERENSDVDIVISYQGELREDDFFAMLHEDGLSIGGMTVDINPITAEKSGTIEEYLARANEYLEEKVKGVREITSDKEKVEVVTEKPEQYLTYYVAECMEFTILGEYHENLTMEEAVALYHSIPSERMRGGKGIGFVLHNASEPGDAFQDMEFDLYSAGTIDVDTINHIPEFRDSPLVQQAIKDMMVHFPDAKIWDRETRANEARASAEQFARDCEEYAIELDQFAEDYDTYEYRDSVEDKEENVQGISNSIQQGDTAQIKKWLQSVIEEEEPAEDVKRAGELLKQLDDLAVRREKNPLTKVEEQEEANYDMIDGTLNNIEPKEELSIMEKLEQSKKRISREDSEGNTQKETEKKAEKYPERGMD
ncbi:MAG: YodL domain-containing protein [Lachnospiraceae bacterium]|nr:YodL domain-containing protein [Lachnospiraceae bacterium]